MTSSFFNSYLGDRRYRAEDWAKYFKQLIGNGYFAKEPTSMKVQAADGLNVKIEAGCCFINGYIGYSEGTDILTIQHGGIKTRIDRVVLRLDTLEKRCIYPHIIQGIVQDSPFCPNVVRSGQIYDLGIAEITVPANASSISQCRIVDTRIDNYLCGAVVGIIKQFDAVDFINRLNEAYNDAWEKFVESVILSNGDIILNITDEKMKKDLKMLKRRHTVVDLFSIM